jgi:hypothetical protein
LWVRGRTTDCFLAWHHHHHQLTMWYVPRAGVIWYKNDQAVIDTTDN